MSSKFRIISASILFALALAFTPCNPLLAGLLATSGGFQVVNEYRSRRAKR